MGRSAPLRRPPARRWALATAALAAVSLGAAGSAQAATDFRSSFEAGDVQPTWLSTAEVGPGGEPRLSGVTGDSAPPLLGSVMRTVRAVTASDENPPNEVKEKLVDGDVNTKWLFRRASGWVAIELRDPVAVRRYALTSANDSDGRDPRDWTLQGSDDGTTWVDLDTRSGEDFPRRFQSRTFELSNATAYRHYRIDIAANSGDTLTQLAELQLSDGSDTPIPGSDMRATLSGGPINGPTMKPAAGWTGTRALQYSGNHTATGRGFAYDKVFDVDVDVTPTTRLSYAVFPELTAGDLRYPSTHVAVDLAFTDGTYLSDLGARDQHGFGLDPRSQGASKSLYADQWNLKRSDIGAVAAGKTVDRILVGYDNPAGSALFNGWVDDIAIEASPAVPNHARPSDWVLTTRGTNSTGGFSRGNNFPAVAVPHGFNFWTPLTQSGSLGTLYEYQRGNNADNLPTLEAFGMSHEPSIWMGDRGTFQVMPAAGAGTPNASRSARRLPFRHENEVARAHYYGVTFENGMRTEIAPTDHAAVFRFTFTGDTSNLIFDNVDNSGGLTIDAANRTISGYSDHRSGLSAGATRYYVYAELDRPIVASGRLPNGGGANVTGYAQFDTTADKTVTMRIGTSLMSVAQAKRNLELEIAPTETFADVRERAQDLWDDQLSVVEVEGATEDQRTTLYSNLYRLNLYPNSGHENVGGAAMPVWKYASPVSPQVRASTPTETGAKIVDGRIYVNNGFWDTYRTTWSAYSLFKPSEAAELVDGFVQHYRDGGWVARWSSPGYANLMTGTSSDVAFAEAYLKGVRVDAQDTFDAALKNATVTPPNDSVGRKGIATGNFLGYAPEETHEAASWSLEGYINDYGIANMAARLAEEAPAGSERRREHAEQAEWFRSRAQNYVHLFNPESGFFQAKTQAGQWRVEADRYDPRIWGHEYTETNGWNFAFHTPQDGAGLAALYGGRDRLGEKLDTFFSTQETGTAEFKGSYGGVIHEMIEARDIRMGMWGASNQVAHHIPYMYLYSDRPWRTQAVVREALSRLFVGSEIGQGYPGDEDNGESSTWQLFGSLGLYPLQVGSDAWAIGSPLFRRATIHLENGRDLVINAPANSAQNVYVQSLRVDGVAHDRSWISHRELADGATLDFEMGPAPSRWASAPGSSPRSIAADGAAPRPLHDTTGAYNGVASRSGGGRVAALLDDDSRTELTVPADAEAGGAAWLRYQFGSDPERIAFYTLTSAAAEGADPTGWRLLGSTDGRRWVVLDERSGQAFRWRRQTRAFKVAAPKSYAAYRLELTGADAGGVRLAEVELLSDSVIDPVPDEEEPRREDPRREDPPAREQPRGEDPRPTPERPAGTKPVLVRGALKASARRVVAIRVRCPETAGGRCRGTLALRVGRTEIGSARVNVPADRATTVRVRITRAAFRTLVRRGSLRPVVTLTTRLEGGLLRQASARMTLKAPRAARAPRRGRR